MLIQWDKQYRYNTVAQDRLVEFAKRAPAKKTIESEIRDYFGQYASDVYWNEDRWFVTLVGHSRWIEVWRDSKSIDVITRLMDEATGVLAWGFAKRLARKFQGTLDEG